MTDLLLDTALTPEQIAYLKATKTSGDALLSLIEDVLDFSKIEAGKLDLEPRPFALLPLVEEIVELLGPRAQAKGLEIASDVDELLPERVMGDPTRLRQVLLNLAGNAIKFTEVGGVSVIVEPGATPGEIVFQVRDTGIGIAPEQQAVLHDKGPRQGNGTGSVLTDHAPGAEATTAAAEPAGEKTPRRIVLITPGERHGLLALRAAGFNGYLVKPVRAASLAAQLTGGAVFEDVAAQAVQRSTAPASKSLAILIAEDNKINALLACSLLAKLGHRPTVAADGSEAVAA